MCTVPTSCPRRRSASSTGAGPGTGPSGCAPASPAGPDTGPGRTSMRRTMTARFDQGPWAAAGVQTVQPGVHRVPLPLPNDGLHAVNVYLLEDLDDDGGIVMIDGGWAIPEARKTRGEGLAALRRATADSRP